MSDRENFIAKMLAEPNDDVNRLVYADWLDDYGEGERDRATAEFIRLSCRMERSERLSRPEGKWLSTGVFGGHDTNYARLLPTLFAWIDKVNANPDRLVYSDGSFVPITHERKGRNLIVKYRRSSHFVPEICTIEFWRGFVRKVTNWHYEASDEFIRLILPDQPLCEPTLRWMESQGAAGNNPNWSSAWSFNIGLNAHGLVPDLPDKTKPDRTTPRNGYWIHTWEHGHPHRWRPQKRRYYAVAWLLRRTAMMEGPSVPVTQTEGESDAE